MQLANNARKVIVLQIQELSDLHWISEKGVLKEQPLWRCMEAAKDVEYLICFDTLVFYSLHEACR